MKERLEYGFDDLPDHFLSGTVSDRWDAERPFWSVFPGCSWDKDAPVGLRLESSLFHQSHEFVEISPEVFLIRVDGDSIDTGGAPVLFDGFKSFCHQFDCDSAGE